jgi:hypothetical protein
MGKTKIGGTYNWISQPERLIYLGEIRDFSGVWHQFAKVDNPSKVWCDVRTADLGKLEETKDSK